MTTTSILFYFIVTIEEWILCCETCEKSPFIFRNQNVLKVFYYFVSFVVLRVISFVIPFKFHLNDPSVVCAGIVASQNSLIEV